MGKDKKLIFDYRLVTNAADGQFDWQIIPLLENTIGLGMTIDSCTGFVEFAPNASNKYYYAMVGIGDAGTDYPFNATQLGAVTDLVKLNEFLDAHRDRIWMTLGGLVKYAAATLEGEKSRIEFDASSKRSLGLGECLVLIVGTQDTGSTGGSTLVASDMTLFYHTV